MKTPARLIPLCTIYISPCIHTIKYKYSFYTIHVSSISQLINSRCFPPSDLQFQLHPLMDNLHSLNWILNSLL